ncbi:MAG: GNAT family N-acetyltransferase [Dehalococcoidia bacterium]|nr:GNAT family N-acetyltransferase [Dehalococcoidia bacterium]
MDDLPTLDGGGFRLRPLGPGDVPALVELLRDPTVARWWGEYDEARVRAEYSEPDDDLGAFAIEVDGELAGLLQFSEEDDPDYRHAGIDISLGAEHQGRGLGPAAIRLLARYLFEARGHHRLTIDPAAANRNTIRAYEAVGFRAIGTMRQYERGSDGSWHDGLLMDLLRDEVTNG